jgi:hypothetical protein
MVTLWTRSPSGAMPAENEIFVKEGESTVMDYDFLPAAVIRWSLTTAGKGR